MEWTAERNPDREYNFRIRELGAGRFAVVSDSERFGADQVVFESFRRGECVDYVTQRRDPGKWNYYVIEDLSSWIRGSENPSPLERFDRFDQAKQRFCELRGRQENDDITDKPHLTMGVGWVGGLIWTCCMCGTEKTCCAMISREAALRIRTASRWR